MTLEEAIAVHMFIWHKPRWMGELKAKNEAWGVINRHAQPIVQKYMDSPGGEEKIKYADANG